MDRRSFVKSTGTIATSAIISTPLIMNQSEKSKLSERNIVGPKEGYTPQVGTLVSMMNWMRHTMLRSVRGLSTRELDYLLDDDANSIGAMLWHLAEVERFYQRKTFDGDQWDGLPRSEDAKWQAAESLGSSARHLIKGYDIDFYLELLDNVRNHSLEKMKCLDDEWLMTVDYNFWGSPTNYYCMWWHVAEHESNHNGQIKMISKRAG